MIFQSLLKTLHQVSDDYVLAFTVKFPYSLIFKNKLLESYMRPIKTASDPGKFYILKFLSAQYQVSEKNDKLIDQEIEELEQMSSMCGNQILDHLGPQSPGIAQETSPTPTLSTAKCDHGGHQLCRMAWWVMPSTWV